MRILIEDALNHWLIKNNEGLAKAIGISPQAVSNRKNRSPYLTEHQALRFAKKHPYVADKLVAMDAARGRK